MANAADDDFLDFLMPSAPGLSPTHLAAPQDAQLRAGNAAVLTAGSMLGVAMSEQLLQPSMGGALAMPQPSGSPALWRYPSPVALLKEEPQTFNFGQAFSPGSPFLLQSSSDTPSSGQQAQQAQQQQHLFAALAAKNMQNSGSMEKDSNDSREQGFDNLHTACSPSSPAMVSERPRHAAGGGAPGKSFKELHAERNKQAQRRFRKRQREKLDELQSRLNQLNSEKDDLHTRSNMLTSALQLRSEELRALRERQAAPADAEEDELAREFSGSVTLTFREDEEVTLTPEQIKKMTDHELARYWSQYVKEAAVLLVAVEGKAEAPPAVVARIQRLVQRELLFLYIRAALTNMSSVKRFVARAKIELVKVALCEEGPLMWRAVAAALALTPAQRADIVALWHAFRAKAGQLIAARAQIHAGFAGTLPDRVCGRSYALQYMRVQELMDALRKNLRREHVLIHEFLSTFYLHKLTPLQMARCIVKSFPYYPDIPAITLWIAAEQRDEAALTKLRALLPETPLP